MFKRNDGKLLKTKIVATMGAPRDEVYDLELKRLGKADDSASFWDTFLEGFFKDNRFLIDVLRLNMAFYTAPGVEQLAVINWLRKNRSRLGNVAILGDLPGPKLRLRGVGDAPIPVTRGQSVRISMQKPASEGTPYICVGHSALIEVDPKVSATLRGITGGQGPPLIVDIGDDDVSLRVISIADSVLQCEAERDGFLTQGRGVTLKGVPLELPSFLDKDREALDFLIENGIDWTEDFTDPESLGSFVALIGVSFVKRREDIIEVKRYIHASMLDRLRKQNPHRSDVLLEKDALRYAPAIIAKIETQQAWDNIDEILDVADGAMVARGDLAEQVGPEAVPAIQKELIRLCNLRGKPVITATEMLASMELSPHPTRAEASDVFNAIWDGSDAVMLSGETSRGPYPYHAVETMVKIAETAEMHYENFQGRRNLGERERRRLNEQRYERVLLGTEELYEELKRRLEKGLNDAALSGDGWLQLMHVERLRWCQNQAITDRFSLSTCVLSNSDVHCKAILAPSISGRTIRMIARFRPEVRIIGTAHDIINRRKLAVSYGVFGINCGMGVAGSKDVYANTDEVFREAARIARKENLLYQGDVVVYTAGTPLFVAGTTNLIQIIEVE